MWHAAWTSAAIIASTSAAIIASTPTTIIQRWVQLVLRLRLRLRALPGALGPVDDVLLHASGASPGLLGGVRTTVRRLLLLLLLICPSG